MESDILFIDYIIFGIVDNAVMLVGAFFGLELEKYFPKRLQVGLGVMVGAGLGNTIGDFLAGVASWNLSLAVGTGLGCLIGLLLIPILHKIKIHYG